MSTRTRGNACVRGNEEYWTKGGSGLEELDAEVALEVNRRTYDGRRGGTTAGEEPGLSRASTSGDWGEEDGENGAKPLHASQTGNN